MDVKGSWLVNPLFAVWQFCARIHKKALHLHVMG